jgi:hypothetical protein
MSLGNAGFAASASQAARRTGAVRKRLSLMEHVFCRIVISAPDCMVKIESDTERKAAEAAEAILRLSKGKTQVVTIEIECMDSTAADRILKYLSDLADEMERV